VKAIALLALMIFSDTVTLTVTVNPDASVSATPPPAPSASPAPATLGAAAAAAAGATTAVILWPRGHELAKCTPNLEPRFSAWREMLEESQGRLCTTTKVPV